MRWESVTGQHDVGYDLIIQPRRCWVTQAVYGERTKADSAFARAGSTAATKAELDYKSAFTVRWASQTYPFPQAQEELPQPVLLDMSKV